MRKHALIGCRIDDVEIERSFQFFIGGVVDDDFDFRLISFAQEARQVGPHHQLFDALCFASDGARFQIARDGVNPDIPRSDGIGNLEFESHGSVRAGEQMRLPESGFAEIAAQFDGLGGSGILVLILLFISIGAMDTASSIVTSP